MIVGCYTLDLYCDKCYEGKESPYDEFPHQFTGHTESKCLRQARRIGWVINTKKRTAICPHCTGKGEYRKF